MRTLVGKKALITGAAHGIGRATALALAREGVGLYMLDLDLDGLTETADLCQRDGVDVVVDRCDLADPGDLAGVVARLRQRWPQLHLLVNNAGICYEGPTVAMTAAQWDRLLQVNLLAPVYLIRSLLPVLLRQEESHVVNVSSIAGLVGFSKLAAYSTSKFALVGLSQALRAEYSGRGPGVTAVCPGYVRTALLHHRMTPDGAAARMPPAWLCATPEVVADRIVGAIRHDLGMVVVTPWARLLWGLQRLSPGLIVGLGKWRRRCRSAVPPSARRGAA